MMGGGGSSYFPSSRPDLQELVQKTKQDADKGRLDSDVNKLIREILGSYERDTEKVNEYLGNIGEILKDEADIEQFRFGGSVAKHTYVDGLSDIDALVILNKDDLAGKPPKSVLNSFYKSLQDRLTFDKVMSVEKGTLAVTVKYRDGIEIQLLPAIRSGTKISIPNAEAKGWNETNPKVFQRALTKANERLNSCLVPTIKIVKSIVSDFPKQKRLTGYHIEALCLESVKGYRASTVKAILGRILEKAPERIKTQITDATGQSSKVDSYLGKSNSTERRIAADALSGVARRLNAATTAEQWKKVIDG